MRESDWHGWLVNDSHKRGAHINIDLKCVVVEEGDEIVSHHGQIRDIDVRSIIEILRTLPSDHLSATDVTFDISQHLTSRVRT